MNLPSWQPIFDADLRTCMLASTGPWLLEWLERMTVEDAARIGGVQNVSSN